MKSNLLFFLCFTTILGVLPSNAQTNPALVGTCAEATAEAVLDIGNVRARILTDGSLFWRGDPSVYEIPKGSGVNALFSDEFWVGGTVNGELRVAANIYGKAEFWPGPIVNIEDPPSDCSEFDRVWSINREEDLVADTNGGILQTDVLEWPVQLGAPFVNVAGSSDYEPKLGDYPYMLGDQMHWWIMNDIGNVHQRMHTNPLGIEVRATAFAFNRLSQLSDVTFYRFEITNRSHETISKMRVGRWADVDLGAAFDDYVGSDSTLSLVYVYNADNVDEDAYGEAPPAIGLVTIEARHSDGSLPSGRTVRADYGDFMTAGMPTYKSASFIGDPRDAIGVYNFLGGIWPTGIPITVGGSGFNTSTIQTKYAFSGDPTTKSFWTEFNTDNQGTAQSPADRRMVTGFGDFDLAPEESVTFTYAYAWARGSDHLDSVTKLKKLALSLHKAKNDLLESQTPVGSGQFVDNNPPATPQYSFWLAPIYPNPSSNRATIDYSLILDGVTEITVFDVLSRQVFFMDQGLQTAGRHDVTIDTSDLKAGVYTVRLHSNRQTATRLLTVVR